MATQKPDEVFQKLKAAGIPVDQIPADKRAVLGELTSEEVNTLVRIHERLQGEVAGYKAGALDDTYGYVIY
jgi:hypothetical protein